MLYKINSDYLENDYIKMRIIADNGTDEALI